MQQSNQLTIDIPSASVFPLVLGKSKSTDFNISNNSNINKAYNTSVIITLANSLELTSSSIPTTNVTNQDTSKVYTFVNIKDFSPNEINYPMNFDVKSNENYKDNTQVNFGTKLSVTITITWDSQPRGTFDVGNIQYYNSSNFEFEITRLSIKKTMPLKRVKGAGTDTIAPSKPFDCIIEVENNTRDNTTFNLIDFLPDSIRYIGNISIISPIQTPLPTPIVTTDSQTANKQVKWNSCVLIKGEYLKFSYKSAIWNKYALNGVENTGSNIEHGTSLATNISATNNDFNVSYNKNITAMDAILTLTDNKTTIDVDDVINYYLNIEVNQYYNIKNVTTTFFTPDGQQPLSTTGGTVLQELANHTIPVEYKISNINANSFYNISLTSTVISQYRLNSQLVSCGDSFVANSNLSASNFYDEAIQDSSSCNQSIIIPTISKTITNIYYRNLQIKDSALAVAPLDWIEYELTFDCSAITAAKKNILLDDFFPLEARLPNIDDIQQISGVSVVPEQISPHGLRWSLGDVTDLTPWKIRLKSQTDSAVTSASLINLFKLTGSTSSGTAYSDRKQTSKLTGKPNITITRYYDNFTPTNVCGGVEYSCRLKISNLQNSDNTATDAFAFQIAEQTYNEITIVPNSWSLSGTGLYITPQGASNYITAQILRLHVGQEITLSYKVTLPSNIYPGFTGNMASQVGVPYTQIFDSLLENVLYSFTTPTSTVQLKTKNITITKNYSNSLLRIGSTINYSLQYTVPKGTAVYNANLTDQLPVGQGLTGNVYLNGNQISVTTTNQNVAFPEILEINPTDNDAVFLYTFSAIINDATISLPTTTQTNSGILSYKNYLNNSFSKSTSTNITIAHPLLSVSLTALNGTILDSKTSFNAKINIENKSTVGAKQCVIQLPIPSNAVYLSGYSQKGSVTFENSTITWNIGDFSGLEKQDLFFSFKGASTISVMDTINLMATLLSYKNDTSTTKMYPPINTNTLTYSTVPNVNISVYPANKTLSGTGFFQFTSNSIIDAYYSIVNKSGGKDSYSIKISPLKWAYDLYINDSFVTSVPALTLYNSSPTSLSQIPSGNQRDLRLKIYVPTLPQPENDTFTITVSSLADTNYFSNIETTLIDP